MVYGIEKINMFVVSYKLLFVRIKVNSVLPKLLHNSSRVYGSPTVTTIHSPSTKRLLEIYGVRVHYYVLLKENRVLEEIF